MKIKFPKLTMLIAAAAFVFAAPLAQAAGDKGELLRDANTTVNHLRTDPAFAQAARMISQARAVYIVPKLVKAGFIFGGEGGDGVILVRNGHHFGEPKFYGMDPRPSVFRRAWNKPSSFSSSTAGGPSKESKPATSSSAPVQASPS
jgi:hypothetical protein